MMIMVGEFSWTKGPKGHKRHRGLEKICLLSPLCPFRRFGPLVHPRATDAHEKLL